MRGSTNIDIFEPWIKIDEKRAAFMFSQEPLEAIKEEDEDMTKEKARGTKRQTKAGMMEKKHRETGKNEEIKSGEDPANTPKMSKNEAEEKSHDKPLH
jgi:hypothetical protein